MGVRSLPTEFATRRIQLGTLEIRAKLAKTRCEPTPTALSGRYRPSRGDRRFGWTAFNLTFAASDHLTPWEWS